MTREVTEIRIDEYGHETHRSWILVRVNRVQSSAGQHLFDSEISHRHFVVVTVTRCTRTRDLNHDHHYGERQLMEWKMSEAQWGAFVSSFGVGNGVPATLSFDHEGPVAEAPFESRLEESVDEVQGAGERALASLQEAHAALDAAFERGAGKKEMRALIRDLGIRMENAPKNMAFAGRSLTEHAENVVTRARADIEAMVLAAESGDRLLAEVAGTPLLETSFEPRTARTEGDSGDGRGTP